MRALLAKLKMFKEKQSKLNFFLNSKIKIEILNGFKKITTNTIKIKKKLKILAEFFDDYVFKKFCLFFFEIKWLFFLI